MDLPRTLAELTPNERNPRKVTPAKLAALKKALDRFGDLGGVVFNVQSGTLVGGHQRRTALGGDCPIVRTKTYAKPTRTGTVAEGYIEVDGEAHRYREVRWDKSTEQAANIAANKGAGVFDEALLGDWFTELEADGFDVGLTMFDSAEIAALRGPEEAPAEAEGQDDEVEPREAPNVKQGQLFKIGNHRLLCGDSTLLADVKKAMGSLTADMVWTDPPYGVSYTGGTGLTIKNDGEQGLRAMLDASLANALVATRKGAVWYVASPPGPLSLQFGNCLDELGVFRQTIIWVKNSLVLGHSDFHYRHEIMYYGWTPDGAHQAPGDRKQDTVWEVPRPTKSKEHPTMKPLALIERSLQHSSRPKDVVFEPFGGSGSTMMACEKAGRRCVSIELDPVYAQVILDRAERLFGLKAELIES